MALLLLGLGAPTLAAYLVTVAANRQVDAVDALAWTVASYLLFFWSVCAWFPDPEALRARRFSLAFFALHGPVSDFRF